MRDEWFVARRGQDGNKRYGPVPLQQLRELVDTGKVQPADLVWREGMANWLRADQCEDLFPAPSSSGPPPDRRGYSAGPGRDPRGYDPDDDRPYPRRRYPQQSSGGWIVALLVGGGVAVLCVVGCAGLLAYGVFSARSGPPPMMKSTATVKTMPPFPMPPAEDLNHGDVFQPPFGGPMVNLGNVLLFRGNSQLYYTAEIQPDQARALGDYLDGQGVFPENRPVTVQVTNPFGTYQVRFCVKAGGEWNPEVFNYYLELRDEIATNVFPGSNVEVHLCDGNMNTVRILHAGD